MDMVSAVANELKRSGLEFAFSLFTDGLGSDGVSVVIRSHPYAFVVDGAKLLGRWSGLPDGWAMEDKPATRWGDICRALESFESD